MTDLKLQEALVGEVREVLESQSVKLPGGSEWKNFHVYSQEKPYKNDEQDDDQENYIIVMLDDENLGEENRWKVHVHMIISICLYEEAHQGNMILADLMNKIYLHLVNRRFVAGMFEMEQEAHKRFNQECYKNFYECDLETVWKLPEIYTSEDFI
jgi:hypothetical protein